MADEELVCSVLLDQKYDFVVVVLKSRTIGELRTEIDTVAREVYPEFRGGQVSRVENQRGSILPDRYKVGNILQNESRIICYSLVDGKERENPKKLRSQQVQMPETVRNKPSVTNNTSKYSLLEAKRTVSDNVCGSSGDMLPATKYQSSLFTTPEHCRLKRKEAMEISACKVAEWLSIHDMSSNVDAQDSESDEGTMEVESESEGQPKPVVGKRVPSITRKDKSDDDEDDNDVDDKDYDGDGSHSEDTDNDDEDDDDDDSSDVGLVESLRDCKQATAEKTTSYTPKFVSDKRDASASVSTTKSKRRAVDCACKKNGGLSMTSRGTQCNLPPSTSERDNSSTNNCALSSLAGNLPKCQVKLKKLPICIEHGRNWKVVHYKTGDETNRRRQRGDVISNRDSKDKGKNKESTPMYLTPIKNGEQIAWLKESSREEDSERTGDEYEDFMKGLEMSDCSITSEESKRSKTENRPPLSTVGQRQTLEGDVEPEFTSQSSIKRRSEQKQQKLQESEDRLQENVNEESVRGRRMISGKSMEGNVELKFISESPIKNKSEQKQRKLQENDDTLEENVNEEIRGERRMISEKILQGNEQLKFTSQSPIKNRSEHKQRKLRQIADRLEENVKGEIVVDRRMISEKATEGNVGFKFTPQSPIKNRSVQKQRKLEQKRETLENNNEESVSDGRVISENTTEGNVELEFTSQSPITSEQKQRKLLEREETVEENVNQESVDERRIITEQTLEGNRRFESTSQSPTKRKRSDRKRRKAEDDDTLERNLHEESVDERRIMSEKTLEGNGRFEFNSPRPMKKRTEQKQRKLQESENTMEENVNDESVDERRIMSEKTLERNGRFEFNSPRPVKKRTEQKQRKLQESENTMEGNVNDESVDERRIISEETLEGNERFEFNSPRPVKKRSEQKQRELQESEDTMEGNVNDESVDERRIISEETLEGNGRLEFNSPTPIKKRSEQKQRKRRESEDTMEENVNGESVDEGGIISEKTLEGNGRFEFNSPSPNKKRSEQKRELQESEDTLVKNVNEQSVDERRIISEETLEGNGRFEFNSPSPNKKRSEQKRELQESEDTLVENVNEESVDSEKTLEGDGRFEFTSPRPIKKRTEQKQRELQESEDTLLENVNEQSVDERRIISEKTLEGDGKFEFTSPSPIKKRSEQKQRKLREGEDTLDGNVNEENVDERGIMPEKTLEGNGRLEFTSQSPRKKRSEQKQRKLQECEDTLDENVNGESVDERETISEKTLEGNGRFQSTSQSPTKKTRSNRKRRKVEDEDKLEENVNEQSVDKRKIISEKTLERNGRIEFTSPSPIKKRSEQKERKLQDSEDTLEENVYEESVSDTAITSKKRLKNNVELECVAKDQDSNNNNIKIAAERKGAKRKWGVLRESDSQASVGMETPKKLAREDGYCEDKQNDEYKKTCDRKTLEGANNISDGLQEGSQIETMKENKKKKKKRKKRKEKSELCGTESTPDSTPTSSFLEDVESSQNKDQQDERVESEFASNVKNKHQISNANAKKKSDCDLLQNQESLAFLGEKNFKKKDRYWKEKRSEDDEKSNDRNTSNEEEKVNNKDDQFQKEIYAQQSKKKKKKKEKKRKDELNNTESASEEPSSPTLETVTSASLNDSGYCENGHNKSKQHQQCVPDQDESVHQPLISKKRKAAANHEKETPSGQGLQTFKPDADFSSDKTNSKKKSKTSLSLLDLALDYTAEQRSSNKASNRKTVLSEGRPAHQMTRHFRQTPKGFLHSARKRKITASTSTIVIRRKPRINPKTNVELTAKEKDLIASGVSLEQLLDDESLWNTSY